MILWKRFHCIAWIGDGHMTMANLQPKLREEHGGSQVPMGLAIASSGSTDHDRASSEDASNAIERNLQ